MFTSMLKLIPVHLTSFLLTDAISLLIRYGDIIFSKMKNPVAVFLDGICEGSSKAIAAILNEKIIGIVVFYDFQYLSEEKFVCYMYGAAKRGVAKYLELAFGEIFKSLKTQGCVAVRFETKKYNLPMRFMARRLRFRKVGSFFAGNITDGKIFENLIYEKIL